MKMKLSKPSRKLAARLLMEVEFENRLIGFKMHRRAGPSPIALYSFEEVVGFLLNPLSQVDLDELAEWVRNVIDDFEVADRINDQSNKNISDMHKAAQIRNLMAKRLAQCKKLI